VIALAAGALAAGLAFYPSIHASNLSALVDALEAAGLVGLLLPLLWRGRGLWISFFLLAAGYATVEASGHAAIVSVVAYAPGLIVLCELVFWAAELPLGAYVETTVIARRLLSLALTAVAAALLALVALMGTYVRLSSGLEAAVVGALAAALLLVIPLVLLRGREESDRARIRS
jgi:hypothetical protein